MVGVACPSTPTSVEGRLVAGLLAGVVAAPPRLAVVGLQLRQRLLELQNVHLRPSGSPPKTVLGSRQLADGADAVAAVGGQTALLPVGRLVARPATLRRAGSAAGSGLGGRTEELRRRVPHPPFALPTG